MSEPLSIIGYDVQLIGELTSKLHKAVRRHYMTTDPSDTRRGQTFEVALPDSRFARVTVELDRVDPDLASLIEKEKGNDG